MLFAALALIFSASLLLGANPISPRDGAIRDSPCGSYAPCEVTCPAGLQVRQTTRTGPMNPQEAAYVAAKAAASKSMWSTYLANANITDFNITSFIPTGSPVPGVTLPNVAMAVSGGGFRAMLTGGGILSGFDNRNSSAVAAGTGGILQLANYAAGLSGGAWCIGSWALADFPTFADMLSVWDLAENALFPKKDDPNLYLDAATSLLAKAAAGFPVASVDPYGRLISYHVFDDLDNPTGPGSTTLFSSIQNVTQFANSAAPFPIIYSTGRELFQANITIANPNYEYTPYAFGLNSPAVGSVDIPIEYLGSSFTSGHPTTNACVQGYENAGWLMGTSGNSITDPGLLLELSANLTTAEQAILEGVFSLIPDSLVDTGIVANPFHGISSSGYVSSGDDTLYLIDGGASYPLTNLPLWPLIQPARKVDVIFAIDDSNDTPDLYPNGAALYAEYQKVSQPGWGAENYPFPRIPTPQQFVASGRNKRISFLGSACQNSSSTAATPLVVYIPKHDVVYAVNGTASATQFSAAQQQGYYANGFAIATAAGNGACLACAMVDAQLARNGAARSAQCQVCFADYCYNA
ncbi:hypothetical protein HWV62_43467 [Athelia sp. TMB]|nr:hypothetical protein HWV62_43467 [Athelia sp. TMB]